MGISFSLNILLKQYQMKKNKLVIAAAGSGKTTYLVNEALKINDEAILITTYTEANEREILKKITEIIGYIPKNITVQTWFSFQIKHGVKPYQSYIYEPDIKGMVLVNSKSGIKFRGKNGKVYYYGEEDPKNFYFSNDSKIYSDKISLFMYRCNEISQGAVIDRLSRIYQHIFIDEVQDLAGYDLEILNLFFLSSINTLLVGDPRQDVYPTHYSTKNKSFSGGEIKNYIIEKCKDINIEVDEQTLTFSHRNNEAICALASQNTP